MASDAPCRSALFAQVLKAAEDKDPEATECLALAFLLSGPLYATEFEWVLRTVLGLGKMSPGWKAAFELAYEKQPPNRRILYRSAMAELYLWFKDYHTGAKYLPVKPVRPEELAQAMEVYLQLKRHDDAKAVAEACAQKMVSCRDPRSLSSLLKALRRYHRATSDREFERNQWQSLIVSMEDQWQKRMMGQLEEVIHQT